MQLSTCRRSVAAFSLLVLGGCADRTITAPAIFWSGHWWPMATSDARRKMYDPSDVTDRYWLYLQATRSPVSDVFRPPTATEKEREVHLCGGTCVSPAGDYCGHCNAWTAAAMREPEPVVSITKTIIRYGTRDPSGHIIVGGTPPVIEEGVPPPDIFADTTVVVFEVGHQKGLLTEIWTRYDGSDAFGNVHGPDVTAVDWHRTLDSFESTGFAIELKPGDPVWNYPVHEVKLRFTDRREGDVLWRDVEARVEYVISVDENFVGQRTDKVTFRYKLKIVRDVVVWGAWDGPWPGSIWRPKRPNSAANTRVLESCVREIINEGDETILIRSSADFRPWPCS